ncbi:hypothetical protein AAVH_27145 [Aphelenchoides avenae]|nr:hypothetical protein AAVH_27145 [Aphelenchus avenae]
MRMEQTINEQAALITHQERKLDALAKKCADYEQVLKKAKKELAESKAMHEKDKSKIVALEKQLSAKAGSPKRLLHAIRVEGYAAFGMVSCVFGTIVERGAQLPVKASRQVALRYNCTYAIVAGDKSLAQFDVGSSPYKSQLNVLLSVEINRNGAVKGSIEYDRTKKQFESVVPV